MADNQILRRIKELRMTESNQKAILRIDKPLVDQRIDIPIEAGIDLQQILAEIEIKPGFAFVVIVNGLVSESKYIVQAGDMIQCLPQITGGMH